jgi:hypothetical protein
MTRSLKTCTYVVQTECQDTALIVGLAVGPNLGTHGGASCQDTALIVGLAVGPNLGTHGGASRQEMVIFVGLLVGAVLGTHGETKCDDKSSKMTSFVWGILVDYRIMLSLLCL